MYMPTPQAGSEGSMLIGLKREGQKPAIEHQTNIISGIATHYLMCMHNIPVTTGVLIA